MPAEPIKVGPFARGLVTGSDDSAIPDDGLVEALNFELDIDGSLRSRPPLSAISATLPLQTAGNAEIIGLFYGGTGAEFVIANDGVSKTYSFDGTTWSLITDTFAASAVTQFDDKAWLVAPPSSVNPGGTWTPSGGFVADSTMPKGDYIISHKARLWVVRGKDAVVNGTRLYYSNVNGSSPFWDSPVADFIDIGDGDGQNIVALSTYYQSILIFRTRSIYNLQYTTDPANGVVAVVVPGIGLENKHCITQKGSYIYFLYEERAYEFVNARANQINVTTKFEETSRISIYDPYSVSSFNERVCFQFWDTTYVFSLKTRTWTRWRTVDHASMGRFADRPRTSDGFFEGICFSNTAVPAGGSRSAQTLSMLDGFSDARSENYMCTMQTKNYDYESATLFKRLFWWDVSAAWSGLMRATASAINFTTKPTWGQLRTNHTWGSLASTQTWGAMSSDVSSNTTERLSTSNGPQRKEGKVGRSLRFKRIFYKVDFETDGTPDTAPVRLYYMTTFVRAGQTIVKDVS